MKPVRKYEPLKNVLHPYCKAAPDRPFPFSGVLPAPYHNWYHNEAQEYFENIRPKRPMASRCIWGAMCE